MQEKNSSDKPQELQIHNLTKLYALLLLGSKKPVTGYRILKRLEQELETTANPTALYKFLRELTEAGYIEEERKESNRSTGYNLTPAGEKFVKKIIGRFDNLLAAAIQSNLTTCVNCGVRLYNGFHIEEIEGKKLHFCCKHCAKAHKQQ